MMVVTKEGKPLEAEEGGIRGRGINRPQEGTPRNETWREDKLSNDYGGNVGKISLVSIKEDNKVIEL